MLGKIEGHEFATMMRTARSVEAFETTTGSRLSFIAKQAFRRVDDVAEMHFPDLALLRQRKYLTNQRNDLILRNILKRGDVVTRAADLEKLVRRDTMLLSRTNRLSSVISRTKKILFLGGMIAVTATGVSYLCQKATEHAASNTGCFLYINENGAIRRYRALGCSLPIPSHIDSDITESGSCRDEDLWSRMRLRESECDLTGDRQDDGQPYYVECDWN